MDVTAGRPPTSDDGRATEILTDGSADDAGRPRLRRAVVLLAATGLAVLALTHLDLNAAPSRSASTRPTPRAAAAPPPTVGVEAYLLDAAAAGLPVVHGTRVRSATGIRTEAGAAQLQASLAPGDYVIDVLCVGAGRASVAISAASPAGGSATDLPVACGPATEPSSVGLSVDGGAIQLVATPDFATTAAVAWRIRQL